jgi:peptide/nickel transport system permease protein
MKRFIRMVIRFVLIISGFLFIFNLPTLIGIGTDHVMIHASDFWTNVKSNFHLLIKTDDPMYLHFFNELDIGTSYQYTMTIIFASLTFILFVATGIAILIMLSPQKVRNRLESMMNIFEAVPDLLVIFLFMFFVITLYKTTGLKIFQLYGVFGAKPYFVPIMTVSFLPLFFLLQFLIKMIKEEEHQDYVLYVRAKGIGRNRILLVHIMRNIFPLLLLQLRTIVWILLSNIYLVEYLFNINGFTQQFMKIIFRGGDFSSLVACLLMLSVPLLLIETIGWMISKLIKGKEAVSI